MDLNYQLQIVQQEIAQNNAMIQRHHHNNESVVNANHIRELRDRNYHLIYIIKAIQEAIQHGGHNNNLHESLMHGHILQRAEYFKKNVQVG